MSHDPRLDPAIVERTERTVGRGGYAVVVGGLVFGMFLLILGQADLSKSVLTATCGVLITLPVVSVLAIFAEEIRRRDWGFALLAATVLALLAYNILLRLTGA